MRMKIHCYFYISDYVAGNICVRRSMSSSWCAGSSYSNKKEEVSIVQREALARRSLKVTSLCWLIMLAKVGTLGEDLRFAQWCGEQSNLLGCYFVLTINSVNDWQGTTSQETSIFKTWYIYGVPLHIIHKGFLLHVKLSASED